MSKYGMVIGRFQPVHMGHQAIVNEILLDGLIPIIVIGSCNHSRDLEKNPLSFEQRVILWRLLYPNTKIHFIRSLDTANDIWYERINSTVEELTEHEGAVLYFHDKEVDRRSFTIGGTYYKNDFFSQYFRDEYWDTKVVEFVDRADIKISANARDIRHDLGGNKHLLDARVYHKLKEWNELER